MYSESVYSQAETEWCTEVEREILAKASAGIDLRGDLIAAWGVAAALLIGLVALSV